MNPIKAIINDFKTDIKFLIQVTEGEYKFPYTFKELIDIRPILKDPQTYIFFMIVIVAVFTGMFMSAKHYQRMANEEIIEAQDFVDSHCSNTTGYYERFKNIDFTEVMEKIEREKADT